MFFREQMVARWTALVGRHLPDHCFFYWPWLGVLVLCLCWLLLMWMTKRTFRIPAQWAGLMLIPVGLLLITIVDFGYWLYVLKQPGYAFVSTLGTLVVVALLWAYRCLTAKRYLRLVFIIVACAVGYPLFGIYGLAAPLLMALWSWRLREHALVDTLVALLCVVAVPLLCYRFVYYQTNLANIYYAALPLYFVTLAMQHCVEQLDWEGVLREAAQQQDEPTRAIVMMKNLALARIGRQGSEMYLYKNGSKAYAAPFGMRTMLIVGPLAYYQYGLLNYSNRLCTEMGVEFGWRAEHLKTLAKCAVLNGEQQPPASILGLLWTYADLQRLGYRTVKLIGDSAAIAPPSEMGFVTRMMHYDNDLTSDQGNVERFLMEQLAGNTYKDDPVFQEQTLLASLWTRNPKQFWYHFFDYVTLHPEGPMPVYLQEAACLFGTLEGRNLDNVPFSPGIRDSF